MKAIDNFFDNQTGYSQSQIVEILNKYNNFGERPNDWEAMFNYSVCYGCYDVMNIIVPLLNDNIRENLHSPLKITIIDWIGKDLIDIYKVVKIFKKHGKLEYLE